MKKKVIIIATDRMVDPAVVGYVKAKDLVEKSNIRKVITH